jgi:hypothetical protein
MASAPTKVMAVVSLRLPAEMVERLRQQAAVEDRSLNSLVRVLLARAMGGR